MSLQPEASNCMDSHADSLDSASRSSTVEDALKKHENKPDHPPSCAGLQEIVDHLDKVWSFPPHTVDLFGEWLTIQTFPLSPPGHLTSESPPDDDINDNDNNMDDMDDDNDNIDNIDDHDPTFITAKPRLPRVMQQLLVSGSASQVNPDGDIITIADGGEVLGHGRTTKGWLAHA
ncbi:hypothetical protein EVJ58_g4434 [Rhodofomes roseus]|uniref:Uncharacterized protein n=1 Tax=Rhodofomes roseus TaxID=34475 RepID=A0A4Y9YIZ6_9APHY|nr:hypothetical protein EVJ58_g4434 [Rhodofomes roseus]